MARGSACHFRGIEGILQAYASQGVPPFAIRSGPTQLLYTYNGDSIEEGQGVLRDFLNKLRVGGSEAIYTLCVYEDWPDNKRIKSADPYDLSFNFCLFSYEDPSPHYNRNSEMTNLLTAMQAEICEIRDRQLELDKEPPEKETGIGAMVGRIFESPRMQEAICAGVVNLMQRFLPMPMPAKVAGVPETGTEEQVNAEFMKAWGKLDKETQLKVTSSLTTMLNYDAEWPDHSVRLAMMAKTDPDKYSMALKFL
jgi:hypothetical protein